MSGNPKRLEGARSPASRSRLWFLGTLPPPLNGQSNANAAMLDELSQLVETTVLPLGATAIGKIWRGIANAATLLLRARSHDLAYASVPGQSGTWLLLPALLALRLRGLAPWFHHHSYRSINRGPQRGIAALVAVAGPAQRHILLSPGMRDRFAALYLHGERGQAHALSNAFLFGAGTGGRSRARSDRAPTLGHASVLTRAKGVFYLLEVFEDLLAVMPDARLIIAGPSTDEVLLAAIEAAVARHPASIDYRGMVTGTAKQDFYADIDLFVLPTTLIDEAEPLVMFEAYAAGVDVMATDTGCIADRIVAHDRLIALDRAEDMSRIARRLADMAIDWEQARAASRAHLAAIDSEAQREGEAFMALLLGNISSGIAKNAVA